ncbi:hypothetical protein KEM52_003476 [Ascosphaera acerosa]|nr:hypothetical protein KEM52_003476 [Ascosphaera acerosa]
MMFEVCTHHPTWWRAFLHMATGWAMSLITLTVPGLPLYVGIYLNYHGRRTVFGVLVLVSIIGFLLHGYFWVPQCSVIRSEMMFIDSICILKALDLWVRRDRFPQWKYKSKPHDLLVALACLTELRYESFTPNFVHTEIDSRPRTVANDSAAVREKAADARRVARQTQPLICSWNSFMTTGILFPITLSEEADFVVHILLFTFFQVFLPQSNPSVVAFEILLAIYLLWEAWQFILRYRNSPRLFGALYKINSINNYWSKIWHTAFMSPSRSLAYEPVRFGLPKLGVPVNIARICGFLATFAFMGAFHIAPLMPLFPWRVLLRIAVFFLLNGFGAVAELLVWGRREHPLKAVLAWVFEMLVAGWAVQTMDLPQGVQQIVWTNACCVNSDW